MREQGCTAPEVGSGLPTGLHWIPGVKGCELFNLVDKIIKSFPIVKVSGLPKQC